MVRHIRGCTEHCELLTLCCEVDRVVVSFRPGKITFERNGPWFDRFQFEAIFTLRWQWGHYSKWACHVSKWKPAIATTNNRNAVEGMRNLRALSTKAVLPFRWACGNSTSPKVVLILDRSDSSTSLLVVSCLKWKFRFSINQFSSAPEAHRISLDTCRT